MPPTSRTAAPEWFQQALMRPRQPGQVQAAGKTVSYQLWDDGMDASDDPRPGVIFVHGSGAHSHWWDFIAGLIDHRLRIVAIDLPGMGDSEHHDSYTPEIFADALLKVSEATGMHTKRNLYLVGHSFGGFATLRTTHVHPDLAAGLIMVDCPIRPPDYDYNRHSSSGPIRPTRPYGTRDEIIRRFRVVPPQPPLAPWIQEYIARYSIQFHGAQEGWRWRFDDQFFNRMSSSGQFQRHLDIEKKLNCKSCFIYGTASMLMAQDVLDYMLAQFIWTGTEVRPLQGLYHHLILEQPQEFAALILELVENWEKEASA